MRGCFHPAIRILVAAAFSAAVGLENPHAAEPVPLQLEAKISLGNVSGRIDHMAIDLARQRLFVAELGNDSIGIVDLKTLTVLRRIQGFKEPQGIGYVPSTDTVYVASAGDGSVRLLQGQDLKETERIELGSDADNVRVDTAGSRVFIGYGQGALAIIDTENSRKVAMIALDGHPESFRLESGGRRIFANVPDAHSVEVIDAQGATVLARWPTGRSSGNFPMALNEASNQVLVVFRSPAMLAAFSTKGGAAVASARTCGDADDVFVDARRNRVYVSCGEGYLDVFETGEDSFRRLAHIPTTPGARTSLFVPELDRLFLAVRARDHEPAAIWDYRPVP